MTRRLRAEFGAWSLVGSLAGATASGQTGGPPVILGVDPPGATVGQAAEWTITGRNLGSARRMLISGAGVEVVECSPSGETSSRVRFRVAADATPGYREVRLDGPNGVSNLAIVRVDHLRQVAEAGPGGGAEPLQVVDEGSAVAGLLRPLDVDVYRIRGTPGRWLTLDLEARRIGTSIAPVLTILGDLGEAAAQAREIRGGDRDCRMTAVVPPGGTFLVQLRDNTYGGGELARYRLRVDPLPYATAIFPLGGRRRETVAVEVSGGNLIEPRRKVVVLPDAVGSMVEVGPVDGPGGPIPAPGRLVVGDGPEMAEPADRPGDTPIGLTPGLTVNGRIARPGEVDAYRLTVRAGDRVRARIEAAAMGSWLDSVLAVRDEKGQTLAENDDGAERVRPDQARGINAPGIAEAAPDSAVEFEARADGVLRIEVSDRFGDGGPEFGYRLSVGPARPDFAVTLLLGNPSAGSVGIANLGQAGTTRTSPGQFGVFNLKPGASAPLNFLVAPVGRPGPVEVRIEGLPEGVTAEPVSVRLAGPPKPGSPAGPTTSPVSDFLQIKVAPYAPPGLAEFRVVASARPSDGVAIEREAGATLGLVTTGVPTRPITRVVSRVPLRVLGEARPRFVGPPSPPTLRKVSVPGPLLLGDRIALGLDFDQSVTADDGSTIDAVAEGFGMAVSLTIPSGMANDSDGSVAEVLVDVLASARAQPGPHPVRVIYTPPGGRPMVRVASVEVRAPIEVRPRAETVFLAPGDSATIPVEVRREAGFEGQIELKLEGLPRGVKLDQPVAISTGQTSAMLRLAMASTAKPMERPTELRVIGMARMPRGIVAVDSKIRPMIRARPAEK
jgi:hypothetical protein